MYARRSDINLTYQGKDISKDIKPYLKNFSFTEHASGEADSISIELADFDNLWINSWFPDKKDSITALIKTINWNGDNDNATHNCGEFVVDNISFSGPPNTMNLEGISTPAEESFNCRKNTKTWEKVTLQQIASGIASYSKIGCFYEAKEIHIDKKEQSEQTDMEFLYELCNDYGLSMKVYSKKLIIFDEEVYEAKPSVKTIKNTDIESWSGNTTLTGIYDTATIKYSDPKKGKNCTYKHTERDGNRNLEINEKADSLADAQIKAKAAIRACNKEEKTVSLKVFPDFSFIATSCVDLEGFGKFDGKYFIDKVTHSLGSGYSMELELHRVVRGTKSLFGLQ